MMMMMIMMMTMIVFCVHGSSCNVAKRNRGMLAVMACAMRKAG